MMAKFIFYPSNVLMSLRFKDHIFSEPFLLSVPSLCIYVCMTFSLSVSSFRVCYSYNTGQIVTDCSNLAFLHVYLMIYVARFFHDNRIIILGTGEYEFTSIYYDLRMNSM